LYWSLVPCFSAADTNMVAPELPGTTISVTSFYMAYIGRQTHFPCICMLACSHEQVLLHIQQRSPGHSQSCVLFPVTNTFHERHNTR
jgi:hypothetical protein